MDIWLMIIIFASFGIGAIIASVILYKGDRLGAYIGMIGGTVIILLGLYPLYGNLYVCEYEPVGNDYYTEKCEIWEP